MQFELRPSKNTGITYQKDSSFNCGMHGIVASVTFRNNGTNSTVTINVSGHNEILQPTQWIALVAPFGTYDMSDYTITFKTIDGTQPAINKCGLIITKYV